MTVALKGRSSCCCVTASGLWGDSGDTGLLSPPSPTGPFLSPLPSLLYLTSPPCLPSLLSFSPFQQHLNTSTNRQKIMQGHTSGSDVLSHVLLRFLCVGSKNKRLVLIIFACCQICPCMCIQASMCMPVHAEKKVHENSTYKCVLVLVGFLLFSVMSSFFFTGLSLNSAWH